jgi:hypothetical protein
VAVEHFATSPPAVHQVAPLGRLMTSVSDDPMQAHLALTKVAWGTRLDLTCTYPKGTEGAGDDGLYALVVHTKDGRTERVATWRGTPGRTMRLTAATAASLGKIRSVDLTWADGVPVAQLQL